MGTIAGLLRRAGYRPLWLRQERSGSGKGWHLIVETKPEIKTPMEVVALQAILGSDPWREACNVQRVRNLDRVPRAWRERDRWNVLYE